MINLNDRGDYSFHLYAFMEKNYFNWSLIKNKQEIAVFSEQSQVLGHEHAALLREAGNVSSH